MSHFWEFSYDSMDTMRTEGLVEISSFPVLPPQKEEAKLQQDQEFLYALPMIQAKNRLREYLLN